jgi:hypothetical protein
MICALIAAFLRASICLSPRAEPFSAYLNYADAATRRQPFAVKRFTRLGLRQEFRMW